MGGMKKSRDKFQGSKNQFKYVNKGVVINEGGNKGKPGGGQGRQNSKVETPKWKPKSGVVIQNKFGVLTEEENVHQVVDFAGKSGLKRGDGATTSGVKNKGERAIKETTANDTTMEECLTNKVWEYISSSDNMSAEEIDKMTEKIDERVRTGIFSEKFINTENNDIEVESDEGETAKFMAEGADPQDQGDFDDVGSQSESMHEQENYGGNQVFQEETEGIRNDSNLL